MPQTLTSPAHSELILKKPLSCCAEPMASRALAQERVQALRQQQHPGATRVCWACWRAGSRRPMTMAGPAAPLVAPCWMCCATQDLGVLATVVRYSVVSGGRRAGAGLHRCRGPGPAGSQGG